MAFPTTPLRIYIEALGGGVSQAVIDGRCSVGVIGTLPLVPPSLTKQWLFGLPLVCVAAPSHPLAAIAGPIKDQVAERHVQIVLTDRSEVTAGQDFGVVGSQSWRVTDLATKHAFLCAGFGYGRMPYPTVVDDIESGRLVIIVLESDMPMLTMPMSAIFRPDARPGRAGCWMIDHLAKVSLSAPARRRAASAR